MRKYFILLIFLTMIILSACGTEEKSGKGEEINRGEETSTTNNEEVSEKVYEEEWKDVTQLEDGAIYDMPTNAKDYIASVNRVFQQEPEQDSKLIQSGYTKYYYFFLEATAMQRGLKTIQVDGEQIEKDFDNLRNLATIIEEEQYRRGEDLNLDDYGENKRDAIKDWKEPSERMKQAVEYTQQLLNDLHVAMNKDEEGETFGVAYLLDGDKKNEIKTFLNDVR